MKLLYRSDNKHVDSVTNLLQGRFPADRGPDTWDGGSLPEEPKPVITRICGDPISSSIYHGPNEDSVDHLPEHNQEDPCPSEGVDGKVFSYP
jgi:hypothetical protein